MAKVSSYIDDLCCHFLCTRQSLGVKASDSNSIFVGNIVVIRSDIDSNGDIEDDASILNRPYRVNFSNIKSIKIANEHPKFILIVEKMTVFEDLLSQRFHRQFPCVVKTGGGEPSLDCRMFVRMVWETLQVPVFALVDCNPAGFEIYKTIAVSILWWPGAK
ncbi:meiotic recombination protein SPO11-like [Chenopodium quinoa]|uniref:meiotic recombination protein SPO11-like n=1 Tax=Chenopodium quinoa TaxID=63459 RepID=UPI000B79AF9E|nr:meiotic recombination protein SPO11-like [Chenopodium quinoa]